MKKLFYNVRNLKPVTTLSGSIYVYDKMKVRKMEVRKQQILGHARKIEISKIVIVTCGDNLT